MSRDLGWSLTDAGIQGAANGLGYLVGALGTAAIVRRIGTAAAFHWGMVVTAVALAATAVSGDFVFLMMVRVVAGTAGAIVFIVGGVIASRISSRAAVPIYFAGAGLGVMFAGVTVPVVGDDWRLAWILLGSAAAVATLASWWAAGRGGDTAQDAGRADVCALWGVALAYFLFAAGYITYITFLSAFLAEGNAPEWQVMVFWTALGLAVISGPPLWSRAIATWPEQRVLVVILAVLSGGASLALVSRHPLVMLASVLVYGAAFMGVPAATTALIRSSIPPSRWTATLAAFTVIFALGQSVGPWAAGQLANGGGTGTTIVWTAVLTGLAAATALLAVRSRPHESPVRATRSTNR